MKHFATAVAGLFVGPPLALAVLAGTAQAATTDPVPVVAEEGPGQTPTPTVSVEPAATPSTACVCTKEYMPVVGVDGKTYGNACEAKCAGVAVAGPKPVKPVKPARPARPERPVKPVGPMKPTKPGKPFQHPWKPHALKGPTLHMLVTITPLGLMTPGTPFPHEKPQPSIEELCPPDLPPGAVC